VSKYSPSRFYPVQVWEIYFFYTLPALNRILNIPNKFLIALWLAGIFADSIMAPNFQLIKGEKI
jgi:hypothetical protein